MNERKNILIFPAGTEIAFEIQNALKYSKFVRLWGGTSADDHSSFTYERLITGFPFISNDGFLEYLNNAIDEYAIDCVYPAHDSVSVFLSDHKLEIHAQVIITEPQTTNICRSKLATYEFLNDTNFIPKYYRSIEDVDTFPVFVKPMVGQGAKGAMKIHNTNELQDAFRQNPNLVICEYLPGKEYTVDCFTDKNGKLLVAKGRTRDRIKDGIAVRSHMIREDDRFLQIAEIINNRFHFLGAWFFQMKENVAGELRLLEISPRIPGTMGLSRNSGINFPMLTLFAFWGCDVSIIDNKYDITLDRALYNAYQIEYDYDTVYVDYDDTLIIENKVNADLVRFLYQASNNGKKIVLISKHTTDIYHDLEEKKIAPQLFDSVLIINKLDEKAQFVKKERAIFIDDSFAERKKIHDCCGIPVFDVDMVESIIDWKK